MNSTWHDNAALYRKMSTPFSDADAANAAVRAFIEGVEKLRMEHKIADVYLVGAVIYSTDDGEEARGMMQWGCGDGMRHEGMVAYALGTVQSDRRQMINKMLAGSKKADR